MYLQQTPATTKVKIFFQSVNAQTKRGRSRAKSKIKNGCKFFVFIRAMGVIFFKFCRLFFEFQRIIHRFLYHCLVILCLFRAQLESRRSRESSQSYKCVCEKAGSQTNTVVTIIFITSNTIKNINFELV